MAASGSGPEIGEGPSSSPTAWLSGPPCYFEARVDRELAKGLSAFDFVLDSVSYKPTEPAAQTRQHLDRLVAAFEEEGQQQQSGYGVKQKLAPEASS